MARRSRGTGRRRASGVRKPSKGKIARPRGLLSSVSDRQTVLYLSVPAPRPDNWRDLGLTTFPPPYREAFSISEPAYWSPETMQKAFAPLLRKVAQRSTSGVSLQILARYGEQGRDEDEVIFEKGVSEIRWYSSKFSEADAWNPKAKTKVIAARSFVKQFANMFAYGAKRKAKGYDSRLAYIYRVGVGLRFKVRKYKFLSKRAERGAWKRRIEEARRTRQ